MNKNVLIILLVLGMVVFLFFIQNFSRFVSEDKNPNQDIDTKETVFSDAGENQEPEDFISSKEDLIVVEKPEAGTSVSSPLTITGQARGYWFFEASFPVVLTDWDGRIIAEGYASAQDDWMTEEFVPFRAELVFESPYHTGDPDFMQRGALILKKDNPSGLPEHDDALEIPVSFTSE